MGDSEGMYTVDEALSTVGFGKYQALLLAYGGLGWIAEAMELMILSLIGSSLQSEWLLSPSQKSLISTVVFAGMLVGAYLWGFVSDTYGRKKGILGVTTFTSVAGLLSAFSPNYATLIVLRCVTGVGLGGMYIFNSWFLEFVPTPNRGIWMIVFSSFWTVGTIFEAALAWIVMPSFGWRWLLALSSVPSFIVLVLYCLAPESPRFLCAKGRIDEARNILEKAASVNGKLLPGGILVSDQTQDDSENTPLLSPRKDNAKSSSSSLLILFSRKLIRTNLLLWLLFFGNTFSYYGIVLLTSELSSDQSKCRGIVLHSQKSQNSSLYTDVFVTSLAGNMNYERHVVKKVSTLFTTIVIKLIDSSFSLLVLFLFSEVPGLIFSAFIVDRVGRKLSMVTMFVLASVLLLPLTTTNPNNEVLTVVLLFGARAFVSATFTVACIYAPEVYPTEIRTSAVGIASAIGKIGGMVCPLVAVGLVDACQQTYALIMFQVIILVSALSVWFSPFETNGMNLSETL